METDYIESLRKQKEDAWEAFDKAREDYNNAMCKKYKEKFEGKFIRWTDISDTDEYKYMYVINIWNSTDSDGNIKIPVLFFEGVYFSGYISEYIDNTWYSWDQYHQVKFQLHDFNDKTLEYKAGFSGGESLMKIITEDEYKKAFTELHNKVFEEQMEFVYSLSNDEEEDVSKKEIN